MKNLPIKKDIENLLQKERSGIWEIKDRNQYLKVTSKLYHHPIRIPVSHYKDLKDAVADAVKCAKVYKKLIMMGLYHPKTEIVIFKDENYLGLMLTMPRLDTGCIYSMDTRFIENRVNEIKSKLSLKGLYHDTFFPFNWGYDKETKKFYFHDAHIEKSYEKVLELADQMGIK